MPHIFMRIWMQNDPYNKEYFIGYALLGVTYIGLCITNTVIYYRRIVSTTSIVIHKKLLQSVISATLPFISETDAGSILNRFAEDMTIIAQKLPEAFLNAAYATISITVDLGIIASGAKYAAAIIPVFVIVLLIIQHYYLRTSRQLRLLDIESRSPINTLFMETTQGIRHIRSFQWQEKFKASLFNSLDNAQVPYYYVFCVQRWLALVMDLCTWAIATVLISLALKFMGMTNESAVGLALLNLVTFSTNLPPTIQVWGNVEITLGAIARVNAFVSSTPVEVDESGTPLPESWPTRGNIQLNMVTAKYRDNDPTAPKVLDNMSLSIEPGQKIGVSGRTGGGKSSLVATMLHMLNYTGTIHIDGRELKTIPRHVLRSRLVTITQEGIALHGTVRFNLDPFDRRSDSDGRVTSEKMIATLTKVGIWDKIETCGGLDADVKDVKLSDGQRQLLSLARAILRKQYTAAKIVLIDEATSNLDLDTDKRMQGVMAESFEDCTVVMVSHRQHAFDKMDAVIRVGEGKILDIMRRDPSTGKLVKSLD
ncbi:hypothetical protein K4F52_006023 [Lecanicillium sp. MT-2017a]|nr:hypothetical protein K4F52_006023 [Lecanicillium sp. MT-2017a]